MYEIQAMAEVEIGSALHVPEVPPEVKHCDNPCHYEELCSHYHSSRHFVWTEHDQVNSTSTSILPSNTRAQIARLLLGPNAMPVSRFACHL